MDASRARQTVSSADGKARIGQEARLDQTGAETRRALVEHAKDLDTVIIDPVEKAEWRPRHRKLTNVCIVSRHMAHEWVFSNQGLRLEQAGTRMTPPLWEDFRVVATNPLHVLEGRCEVYDLHELTAMEVNIGFGRRAFVFGIPRVHPFVYGLLRYEGALVCAGDRFADHPTFRLRAPLQTLNGLFGQPCSGTVLPMRLLLKPGFEFGVETQGESARAAHEEPPFD